MFDILTEWILKKDLHLLPESKEHIIEMKITAWLYTESVGLQFCNVVTQASVEPYFQNNPEGS